MKARHVLDCNACRNCRRPIQKLAGVGWVHGELPQYAHEEPTCDKPVPVDARCPFCGQLVAGQNAGDGFKRLGRHDAGSVGLCEGTGSLQPVPE